jgi:hypothetical protein
MKPREDGNETLGIDDDEISYPTVNGQRVVVPDPHASAVFGVEVSYVRFVDREERELLYYDEQEWVEDPRSVMAAIITAIFTGVPD